MIPETLAAIQERALDAQARGWRIARGQSWSLQGDTGYFEGCHGWTAWVEGDDLPAGTGTHESGIQAPVIARLHAANPTLAYARAAFLVAAAEDVLALVAEVERLRAVVLRYADTDKWGLNDSDDSLSVWIGDEDADEGPDLALTALSGASLVPAAPEGAV